MYNKNNPFLASIKERYLLSKPGSIKRTTHVVLDIHGSGITYQVGDCIGVFPTNEPELIDKTLHAMKATGREEIKDRHTGQTYFLYDYFFQKANLSQVSRKFILEISKKTNLPALQDMLSETHKEQLREYLQTREVWDTLNEWPDAVFSPQEVCDLLMPLLPRFYSIASSNLVVGEEIHLTVAPLDFVTNDEPRKGVCTHFLVDRAQMNKFNIPIYVQPQHGFTLPEDQSKDIIMVGPGTGVAPYRGFMQERVWSNATGRNWLFFGECNRAYDFFYEEEWNEWIKHGKLRLNAAFSRDQENKVYVQNHLQELGAEVFDWIHQGAIFYVCGDAHHMAKDVDAILHHIIQEQGKMTHEEARQYVKQLRTEKRYLRDVY